MNFIQQISFLLRLTRSHSIIRRYFVVNGFDGAVTMLGLILGFLLSTGDDLSVVINVCLGAAVALFVSGVSSAYISETAERRRELHKLEGAMVTNLEQTAHGNAVRQIPILIALVNGSAPLLISLIILTPLWLAQAGILPQLPPLHAAIGLALLIMFLLGVFLGRVAGIVWWRSGLQTLAVALITLALIYLITGD